MSVALAELDTAPQTIEPVVNYIVNDGTEVFTYTGGPGSRDVQNGGTPDPAQGRHAQRPPAPERIQARRRRLPLRPPRHQGAELLRRGRNQARLLSGDGGADQSRERRQARRRVRSHAAHRRRCASARSRKSARSCAAPTTTTPNSPARSACSDILPDEADELLKRASPSSRCGGRSAIRSRPIRSPSPTPAASSPDDFIISERRYPDRDRPDLRHRLQPEAQVVLVPAPGARRGAGVQGLRLGEGRPRPLDRAHRLRRSDHAAQRAAAREHRNPHAGVFLNRFAIRSRRSAVSIAPRSSARTECRKPTRKANAIRPTSRRRRRDFS